MPDNQLNIQGFIIILGSPNSETGELYQPAKERCELALSEYNKLGNYKILCTGGYGNHFNTSSKPHAFYLKNYLIKRGIPENSFVEFAESKNTITDATLSKEIVLKYGVKDIRVITSDYHLNRALFLFKKNYADTDIHLLFSVSKTDEKNCEFDLEEIKQHETKSLNYLKTLKYD